MQINDEVFYCVKVYLDVSSNHFQDIFEKSNRKTTFSIKHQCLNQQALLLFFPL